jgi:threonine dehydratase
MVELVDQVADLDIVLASVVGGGLISGLCLAADALRSRIAIFVCEPAGALDAMESVKQDCFVSMPNPNTLADSLRTSLEGTGPPDSLSARDGVLFGGRRGNCTGNAICL